MADFPSPSSAYGRWNLMDVRDAVMGGNWPLPTVFTDPYFPYVTMLLPGNGTNGEQNNTFLDSSTSNFNITRNGNTTQGTFSPYGPNWSTFFNGSTDYLSTAYNNDFDISTPTSFTVEAWIYRNGTGDSDWRVVGGSATSSGFFGGRGTLSLGLGRSTIAWDLESASNVYSLNTWTHVAYVRNSSNVLSIFANGVRVATTTTSVNFGLNGGALQIGAERGGQFFGGYISNVRVLRGGPVYDPNASTITVPTAPFPSTEGFLTCQSNRFIDTASGNFPITINGTPRIQRSSPFSPTAAYSTSVIGGSGYFDGTGDYLTAPDNVAWDLGSNNFTIESWVYPTASPSQPMIIGQWTSSYSWTMQLSNNSSRNLRALLYNGSFNDYVSTSPLQLNAWNHCAFVRESNTVSLYLNGARVFTTTFTGSVSNSTSNVSVGADASGSQPLRGYITNSRVVNGTALYSGTTYTVPTAPLSAVTNTKILLNNTNGAIIDNAMMNNLETVGNAQISTSVSKFGGGSMAFDGTGDWLIMPYGPTQDFGTGAFTIEMWAYLNSLSASYYVPAGTWGSGTSDEWLIQIQNNGSIRFLTTSGSTFYSASITTSTWYHIAVVRNASIVTIYVNGTSVGSYTCSNSLGSVSKTLYIGSQAGTWDWNGYIDDFRITKGYARYTANFTPPTEAFPIL